ncbi:MAG: hypothetical protein HY606_08520 [Planctomycetes bacterium]|nr:hypothetical protein [Planctomycetota bacterium]
MKKLLFGLSTGVILITFSSNNLELVKGTLLIGTQRPAVSNIVGIMPAISSNFQGQYMVVDDGGFNTIFVDPNNINNILGIITTLGGYSRGAFGIQENIGQVMDGVFIDDGAGATNSQQYCVFHVENANTNTTFGSGGALKLDRFNSALQKIGTSIDIDTRTGFDGGSYQTTGFDSVDTDYDTSRNIIVTAYSARTPETAGTTTILASEIFIQTIRVTNTGVTINLDTEQISPDPVSAPPPTNIIMGFKPMITKTAGGIYLCTYNQYTFYYTGGASAANRPVHASTDGIVGVRFTISSTGVITILDSTPFQIAQNSNVMNGYIGPVGGGGVNDGFYDATMQGDIGFSNGFFYAAYKDMERKFIGASTTPVDVPFIRYKKITPGSSSTVKASVSPESTAKGTDVTPITTTSSSGFGEQGSTQNIPTQRHPPTIAAGNSTMLMVWSQEKLPHKTNALLSHEVRGRLLDTNGSMIGNEIRVFSSIPTDVRNPIIKFSAGRSKYLINAERRIISFYTDVNQNNYTVIAASNILVKEYDEGGSGGEIAATDSNALSQFGETSVSLPPVIGQFANIVFDYLPALMIGSGTDVFSSYASFKLTKDSPGTPATQINPNANTLRSIMVDKIPTSISGTSTSGGKKSKTICYIATSTKLGTANNAFNNLQGFRSGYLSNTPLGSTLNHIYGNVASKTAYMVTGSRDVRTILSLVVSMLSSGMIITLASITLGLLAVRRRFSASK